MPYLVLSVQAMTFKHIKVRTSSDFIRLSAVIVLFLSFILSCLFTSLHFYIGAMPEEIPRLFFPCFKPQRWEAGVEERISSNQAERVAVLGSSFPHVQEAVMFHESFVLCSFTCPSYGGSTVV
jgi:hypothetical protein